MERDGFCRSERSKLNYFLPRDAKGQEKIRACACHGFQTGLQSVLQPYINKFPLQSEWKIHTFPYIIWKKNRNHF